MKTGTAIAILTLTMTLLFPRMTRGQETDPLAPWFPLHIGNTWNYGLHDTTIVRTDRISDTVSIGEQMYFLYTRFEGSLYPIFDTVRADSMGRIWLYGNGGEQIWFDFTLGEGETYLFRQPGLFDSTIVTLNRGWTYACDFDSCLALSFDVPEVVDEEHTFLFARGIGPVAQFGAWSYYSFHSAVINDSVITSVDDDGPVPESYALDQNYPNPFNPVTKISFTLPSAGPASLKIFDLLGRELATLVDGRIAAGPHTVEWDAGGVSGGVYFYRLNADGFHQTRKMVVLR